MRFKVCIAVGGKFHAFHLAEELQKRGCLARLLTPYFNPRRNAWGYRIDPTLVKTHLPSAILTYGHHILPQLSKMPFRERLASEVFDYWVARYLDNCDILVAWAGWAYHCFKAAKQNGIITVLDRACPHIDYQLNIINEERIHFGEKSIRKSFVHKKMVQEYDIADYIVVPSTYSYKSFVERGFERSKIIRIPLSHGISVPRFQKRLSHNNEEFNLLYVGGNPYRKGIGYLLQAWEELNLKGATLIIKGSLEKPFATIIKKSRMKLINWHLTNEELEVLYHNSCAFCLPSIDDGFGMVVLEAMASGLPVIVTTNVGASDIVRNGVDGFIVPIRDVEALKEKILYLYEHRDTCEEMGYKALERAKEFTWGRYGERMQAFYQNVLAARQSGA